jgi:hypothetical protein
MTHEERLRELESGLRNLTRWYRQWNGSPDGWIKATDVDALLSAAPVSTPTPAEMREMAPELESIAYDLEAAASTPDTYYHVDRIRMFAKRLRAAADALEGKVEGDQGETPPRSRPFRPSPSMACRPTRWC